jgi:nitroreductase/NAD-dependent dihydropyrimidine dehydrogenase PreA subunit
MTDAITFNTQTCKACGTCADVCPSKIMRKVDAKITFREDRAPFCIKCGQCMAVCPTRSIQVNGLSYEKDFFPLSSVDTYENAFFDMIGSRRAVRNFKDKAVPRELLEKIVSAITYAPPSFPPIKTEIIVVQNTSIIRQALPAMIEMYDMLVKAMANPIARNFIKKGAGTEKFRVLEKHVVPLMKNRLPELKEGTEDTITRHAPAMIIFHANKKAENYHEDIYIAMTFGILAAHALGLGASMIDLIAPAIEREKKLRKLFSIPEGNEVVATMILGYPKYKYQRGIKRQLKSVGWI